MKTTHVLRLFLRHWLVIGLVTIAVGAAVFAVSETRTPQYTATSSVYLTIATGPSASNLAQGSTYLQDQMDSFGELATSARVLNTVIDDLHLNTTAKELAKSVTATIPRNTVILQIDAIDPDPRTAASIANAVTTEFSQQLATVGPKSTTGTPLVEAQSIQVALPPATQTSPNNTVNTALGLLVGLALACAGVYLAARLDDKLRNADRVAALGIGEVLGSLQQDSGLAGRELAVLRDPTGPLAAEFRQLAATTEAAAGNDAGVLLVTSANRGDGRTVVAANLAAALAERGNRVALIDADLRNPRIAAVTGADAEPGVAQALTATSSAPAQTPDGLDFAVISAGGSDPNPTAALSGEPMRALLQSTAAAYDLVIVDGGPLLGVSDATAVGKHVPTVIIVGNARRTSRDQLQTAVDTATGAGLRPLGIVLNQVRPD